MAEKKDQAKPLAPAAAHRIENYERDDLSLDFTSRRRQKCIKCCGCSAAIVLILAIILLILKFTVFTVKDPKMKMNSVKIDGLDILNNSTNFGRPGLNMTVVADVSIKNPNVEAFKFHNTTTLLYYGGSVVGKLESPAGQVRARKTLRMNVSADVMVDKIVEVGRFKNDLEAGIFPLSTCTRITGEVKIAGVVRGNIVVKMNCTMNAYVSRQAIQDRICTTRVSL